MVQNAGKRPPTRGNGVIQTGTKKTKKKLKMKKFKNTRLFKLLRIILVIIILVLLINLIKGLFHKKPENISLVVGSKNVELVHTVEIDKDNNIYLSIDDVKNLYDSNIYYSNNILITTYNKHIAVLEKGKTTMKVNDVVTQIKGTLKNIDGTMYLPFTDMSEIYDFESNYNDDTKVFTVDSKSEEKKESIVIKNVKVKKEPKLFSETIEKVKKSKYVTVFETEGKYTKVRTVDGNIGYVKTKSLSKPEILWENMDEKKLENVKVLSEYSNVDANYQVLEKTIKDAIVTPNLFRIVENSDGKIEVQKIMSFENDTLIAYRNWANGSEVTICPVVTLDCNMSKVCASYESRSLVINTLCNELVTNRLNMICVDFAQIDDTEGLYRFMTEMVPRFKSAGMKVLIKQNTSLRKERLNNIVDYVLD